MNKKTAMLLCLLVLAACLFGAVACELAEEHTYVEHAAVAATCTAEGNELYYTCKNCDKIFDKDKNEIESVPTVAKTAHDYEEHAAVAATCTTDGQELYYTCKNGCGTLFDKDKNVIDSVPVLKATDHDMQWVKSEDGKTAELKCQNGTCTESKGTINLTIAEEERKVVDFDNDSQVEIDLTLFGEGLNATAVSYDGKTATLVVDGNNASFNTAALFDYAAGKVSVTITLSKEGKTIEAEMLLTVAKIVDSVEDLLALRPLLTDNQASVKGGEVNEVDGHKQVTRYYYLLTTDLDGKTRTEETSVFGEDIVDSGYTSGNGKSGFVGIFDGNGNTIRNFTLNIRGFFGHVGGGTIANVNFENIVLNNADSSVLGKLMAANVTDVTISNVETTATLSDTAAIVAYHEIFGSTIDGLTVDLSKNTVRGHILAKQLTDGDGEWKANAFGNVVIKTEYGITSDIVGGKALTDEISGVTVKFNPFAIEKPAANDETYYYTGNELTYELAESSLYTISGNKQTEVGSYTVTVSLKPYEGLTWADGTTADITFTFEIAELTDDKAKEISDAFAEKVAAFAEQYRAPRDIITLNELLAEYEVLHVKVQGMLTETKATLDSLATGAQKYARLDVAFDTVKLQTALNGYDEYYLVIYNPTDGEVNFYYASGKDWRSDGSCTLASKAYSQVVLKTDFAVEGNIYMYGNGASIDFNQGVWICIVYGTRDEAKGAQLAEAFKNAVAAIGEPLTVQDKDNIVAAREAYNALTPYALTLIDSADIDKLVASENAIGALVDQAAAKLVADMIEALSDESGAEDVVEVSNAYDQLTQAQKAYITAEQLAKLNAQKERAKEEVIAAQVNAFKTKYEALGTPVLPKDKDAVTALAKEYDGLSDDVKARLVDIKTNLDAYVEQAASYVELNVQFGSDRIVTKLSGYEKYYLVIYNPTDADVSFYYAGDVSWSGAGRGTLKSTEYTQVEYETRFAEAGNAYVYGNGATINFNDTESGWICKVYGKKSESGSETVVLSVGGSTDNETYGKVLETSAANGYFEQWGTMSKATLESLAAFDNVHFYIYNPSDVDIAFFFQENKDWTGLDRTVLTAKSWTRVNVSQALTLPEGATMVYVDVDKTTEGFVADGWMISDFFGTVK